MKTSPDLFVSHMGCAAAQAHALMLDGLKILTLLHSQQQLLHGHRYCHHCPH